MGTSKNNTRIGFKAAATFILILGLSTCDIFQPGLGEAVDINAPTVVLESHRNGDYVGGQLRLAGVIEDDTSVSSVQVEVNGRTVNAELDGDAWSAWINTTTLSDGDHEFTISATDSSAKRTNLRVLLTVDNNPPTVLVNSPSNYLSSEFNNTLFISGEALDTTRVQSVRVSLLTASGQDPSGDGSLSNILATGRTSWSASLDVSGLPVADYRLVVSAADPSGNVNSHFYHFFDLLSNAVNPADVPSIVDVNDADLGAADISSRLSVSLASIRHSLNQNPLIIRVDPNSDLPQFDFISPNEGEPASFTAAQQVFIGNVFDDDGFFSSDWDIDPYLFLEVFEYQGVFSYNDGLDADGNPDGSPDDRVLLPSNGSGGTAKRVSYGIQVNGNQWSYTASTLETGKQYYLRLTAVDLNGVSASSDASANVTFSIPEGIPSVEIVSPSQGSFIGPGTSVRLQLHLTNLKGGSIDLDLDADNDWDDDDDGVADRQFDLSATSDGVNGLLQLDYDGNPLTDDALYGIELIPGTDFVLADGTQSFRIRSGITDAYGFTIFQFVGDTQQPTASITVPSEGAVLNGTVNFNGLATDGSNPLENNYLKILSGSFAIGDPETDPPASFDAGDLAAAGWFNPDGGSSVNWQVTAVDTESDSRLNLPDTEGDYTLVYYSRDAAQNISDPVVRHFSIDQSSDFPVFSFTNLITDGSVPVNALSLGEDIFGEIRDDDSVDVSTLEVRINQDNNNDGDTDDSGETGVWQALTGPPVSDGGQVSFRHDTGITDQKIYSIELRVDDIYGVSSLPVGPYLFTLDLGPPSLSGLTEELGAPWGTLTLAKRTDFGFAGDVNDANGVESVVISQSKDGGPQTPVAITLMGSPGDPARSWTASTDFSAGEGTYVFTIEMTDSVGGQGSETRTVLVDTTAPASVTISNPAAGQTGLSALGGSAFPFAGTASDAASGIGRILYEVSQNPAASTNIGDYVPVATSGNWSFTDDFDTDGPAADTGRAEGRWYLHVIAEDSAGNLTPFASAASVMFDIDQNAPSLSETSSGIPGSSVVYRNTTVNLGGSAADSNALASVVVEYSKDAGPAVQLLNDTTDDGSWATTLTTAGGDGAYEVTITATDEVGRTRELIRNIIIDTADPDLTVISPVENEFIDGANYTIRGQVTDNSGRGVVSLEYSLDGTNYTAIPLSGLNWSAANIDFSPGGEGAKTLYVRASDGINPYGPASEKAVNIYFDTAPPSLTETTAVAATNSDLVISGTANDTNGFNDVVITATTDGADQGTVYTNASPGAYSYTKTLPGDGSEDGSWVFTITATDVAGRSTELIRAVEIDEQAPESVTINDPGDYLSGNLAAILGTASDAGSGIAAPSGGTVQYSLDFTDDGNDANDSWVNVSGTAGNWNISLDLDTDGTGADTGLSEGAHRIWVRAQDRAGNITVANDNGDTSDDFANRVFVVDQAAPFVSNLREEAGADWGDTILYKAADFTISGTANDTNGVNTVIVRQSKDGGAAVPLTVTLNGSLGDTARTWNVDTDISAGQGSYVYEIVIRDVVGRQTSILKTVVVDQSAPNAPVVSSPTVDQWLSGASFSASGTASDVGSAGISRVYYQVDTRGATPPADLSDPSWNIASGSGSWNGSFSITGEGERSIFVVAVDNAGNESPMTTVNYGIDQNNPLIAITGGVSTAYENADFSFSGTASDSNAIGEITVEERYGAGAYGAPVNAVWNAGPGTWTYNRTLVGGDLDGVYTFRFTAVDAAGKTVSLEKDVSLDRVGPVIAFGNPVPFIDDFPADLGRVYGNGVMSISGTVSEDNGVGNLASLEYSLDGGSSWTPLALGSAFTINGIDTTLIADGLDLTVRVRSGDRNGNSASQDYVIRIDQDSDKPVVSISAPGAGDTIASQTINVSGSISDDDGVGLDPDSVQYRFSSDGGSTWTAWTNVSTSGSITDRSFSFTINSATDGNKAIEIRGEDVNAAPVLSDVASVSFTQDTGAPDLTGLLPAAFSYQSGDFAVSATATDSNGVENVAVRILRDGTQIQPFTNLTDSGVQISGIAGDSPRTINFTVDTSSGGGLYQIILRSEDSGGNTREDSVQLYVDKTAPGLAFTSPTPGSTRNNTISISGTTSDNYGVANLDFRIVDVNNFNSEEVLPTGVLGGISNWTISAFDTRNTTLLNYANDLGGGLYELTLRALVTDQAGNVYSTAGGNDLVFRIDQSEDRPQVMLDDIAFDGSSSITSSTITGTVTDDDGVSAILIDAYAVDNSIAAQTVNLVSGSYGDTSIDFSVTLSSNENGLRGIRIRAVDTVDNNGADYGVNDFSRTDTGEIDFLLDTQLPDLDITSPVANITWSSDDSFDFAGTSADETGIVLLEYKFDDSDLDSGAVSIGAPYDNWSFSVAQAALADGPHTLYVRATDGVGKTRVSSRSFVVDKSAPTINVTSPANGSAVFGPLTIGGTTSDNAGGAGVASVSIGLGKQIDPTNAATLEASTWINTGGTTSWNYSFLNINDYANSTFSTNTGDLDGDGNVDAGETWTDLWDFTFYVRAEDSAGVSGDGNISYLTSYQLQIDPKRDRPEVTILSPGDGSTVGGFVRVFGSAFDSQFVEKIQIAIDANNNGIYTDDVWAEGTLDETDGGVNWYQVNGTNSWNINLNESGEFDPSVGSTRTITFKVRAKDYKETPGDGIFGAEEEVSITFNKDFPQFADINLISGDTVSGTYGLSGLVRDETDIDRIIYSNEGPLLNNTIIFDNPGGLLPVGGANVTGLETPAAAGLGITVELLGTADPDYDPAFPGSYRIGVPINTEAAGLYPNGAGSMSVKITAEDTTSPSPFTNQNLISFSVDNIDPSSLTYTGDTEILGTAAEVQGTVRDTGTVAGIDRIVLFMENRIGELVRLKGGTGSIGAFVAEDVYDLSNAIYNDYRIVIDNSLEGGAVGDDSLPSGDNDGFDERLALSAGTYQWSALFDSTLVSDGAVTLRYRAVDLAGNMAEDSTAAFIANNKPSINSLVLGTDLDGSGTVEVDEQNSIISAGYAASNFTARNDRLYIGVNASGGNGTLRYSVIYNTVEQNGTLTDGTIEIDTSGFTESAADNDQSITITIYDSTTSDDADATDELSDSLTLGFTVDNVDSTPPSIAVADFGFRYSESNNDASKTLDAVGDYNENIAMSGQTRLGHVEYGSDSQYDGADPDVSGRIIIRGKVEDNQIIDRIEAAIPGYDPGTGLGNPFDVYSAAGGALNTADWTFSVDGANYLTESNGNVLNWAFEWDSSSIASIAQSNVTVSFTVYDANGVPNSDSDAITVDIVPYISQLLRNPGSFNTNRTKYGRYPVQQGEAGVEIHGFNLLKAVPADPVNDPNEWVRVYNAAGSADDRTTITSADADGGRIVVSLSGVTHSGILRVNVNGIEAINHINDNSLDYNKEDDGNGIASTLWTDDRYLFVWETGDSLANSNDPEHPSLHVDSTGTLYGSWVNYATSQAYYGTTAARTLIHNKFDPPEFTDIYLDAADNIQVAYLGNYFNGGTQWGFLTVYNPDADAEGDLGGYNGYYVDWLGHDNLLFQFQNPRVVREGNDIHVAYFDNNEKTLKYGYIPNGRSNQTWDDDGGPLMPDGSGAGLVQLNLDGGNAGAGQGGIAPTSLAGQYVAVDVDEFGNPVIMYYDIFNQTLRLAYANTTNPTAYADWTIQTVFRNDDPNRSFSGQYVSMKIDPSGAVHAAFYRTSTGDLVYITAPDADGVDYVFDYSQTVDSEGAVGTWIDLDLEGTTPHISYINNAMVGTFDGLKYAYQDGGLGDWEYEMVPLATTIQNKRTGIVRFSAAAWGETAIGYGSNNFDLVYRKGEEP